MNKISDIFVYFCTFENFIIKLLHKIREYLCLDCLINSSFGQSHRWLHFMSMFLSLPVIIIAY